MSTPFETTQALYNAQMDFCQRTAALLQENGQHWMEVSARRLQDSTQAPSTDPARILQRQIGDVQGLVEDVVATQTALLGHLGEAVQEWQQASAAALQGGSSDLQPAPYWADWMNAINTPFQAAAKAATQTAAKAAPKSGPARK